MPTAHLWLSERSIITNLGIKQEGSLTGTLRAGAAVPLLPPPPPPPPTGGGASPVRLDLLHPP